MQYYHTHPFVILTNMTRFLYLLVIPTLRGLFYALFSNFSAWLASAWLDLLALGGIVLFALIRWLAVTYSITPASVRYRRGVFVRTELVIPTGRICAVSTSRPWYLAPFLAVWLSIDTLGGHARRADLTLCVSKKRMHTIIDLYRIGQRRKPIVRRRYTPDNAHVALFALLTSDSFGGVLFAGVLISRLGSLIGQDVQAQFLGVINDFTRMVAFGVPTAALVFSLFLLFGWLIAFFRNLAKHHRMDIRQQGRHLRLTAGLVTRRTYFLDTDKASFIVVKRSLVSLLLRLYTVYFDCAGFGKTDEDMKVLLLSCRKPEYQRLLSPLLPRFHESDPSVRPRGLAVFRFIGWPLGFVLLLPVATWVLAWLLPLFAPSVRFAGMMACVPAVWLLLTQWIGYFSSGVGLAEGCLTLRFPQRFALCSVVLPQENVTAVRVRQSLFQRAGKSCDLFLYAGFDRATVHHLKSLPLAEVRRLFPQTAVGNQPERTESVRP